MMELCTTLCLVAVVVLLILFARADADLTLLWNAKFGKKADSLRGKVVWITGASSGIGEYLAYELVAAGCKLVLSARRKEELERVKKQCLVSGQIKEEEILVLPLDVVRVETHGKAVEQVMQHFGKIDILVNNAGKSQRALTSRTSVQVDRDLMEINFVGTVSLTKAVLPHMQKRKSGQIVVTSSIAGKVASPISATYTATKFAVNGWFDSLRMEVCQDNISVVVVCPGPVLSNITKYAATEEPGKDWGNLQGDDVSRMKTSRCAELMALAMANELDEVWVSPHPILFFTYVAQYMPYVTKKLGRVFGGRMIRLLKENKSPY